MVGATINTREYKNSDVGLIPEDWEVKKLLEIGESIIGLTYSPSNVKLYGKLVLRSSNVQNGKLAFEDNVFVDMDFPTRVIVKENDILICVRNGSRRLIGKCALIDKKTSGSAFGAFMSVYRSEYSTFVFHQFQSFIIQRQINETLGATINQITNKDLASFRVPLPPTKAEQIAIVTALNDADNLIQKVEQLLAKKRNIRTGVMQELLKPKSNWNVKPLKSVIESFIDYRGVTPKKLGMQWGNGNIPALSANNVQMGYVDFQKECYFASEDLYKRWMRNGDCQFNDILITMEAPLGNIAYIPDSNKYILSQRTVLLRPVDNIDKIFFKFYLMHSDFQKLLLENASGSTAQGIKRKTLEMLPISFPKDKNEQKSISQIISDTDSEVIALENYLEKFKMVKQGMMQNLLTGKIRLI